MSRSACQLEPIRQSGPRRTGRVDRLPAFLGGPDDAREILADLKILGVAAGSVGAKALDHLARCHVGELGIVDPKDFTASFDTQSIRDESNVGRSKALLVGRWAKDVSPETTVCVYPGPVQDLAWPSLARYDAVLASTDNLKAETETGQIARWLGLPLVLAAVDGPTLTAQVRVYTNRDETSACPACGFGRAERRQLSDEVLFNCDPAGAGTAIIDGPPTTSLSALCGMAASMATLELLRQALGLGPAAEDRLLEYNAYAGRTTVTPLRRRADCACDHTVLDRAAVPGPLAERTLRECAAAAGVTGDEAIARSAFDVDDLVFAWFVTCNRCGTTQPFNRFIGRHEDACRLCSVCSGLRHSPDAFYSFGRLIPAGAAGLMPLLDTPLGALGAAGIGITVRHGPQAVLVQSRDRRKGAHR